MKIGCVRYNPARGVQVREEGNLDEMHSAVSGTIAVYTDSLTETQKILNGWDEIMQVISDKAHEILSR